MYPRTRNLCRMYRPSSMTYLWRASSVPYYLETLIINGLPQVVVALGLLLRGVEGEQRLLLPDAGLHTAFEVEEGAHGDAPFLSRLALVQLVDLDGLVLHCGAVQHGQGDPLLGPQRGVLVGQVLAELADGVQALGPRKHVTVLVEVSVAEVGVSWAPAAQSGRRIGRGGELCGDGGIHGGVGRFLEHRHGILGSVDGGWEIDCCGRRYVLEICSRGQLRSMVRYLERWQQARDRKGIVLILGRGGSGSG
ncbi:hypothetical protein PG991_013421 [Apiospora marii]|uniref:Uncharacterized protein n=1 Tax=Apiospora marii TaxID=335849 RepID=A0ABR1R7U8_9PEZI